MAHTQMTRCPDVPLDVARLVLEEAAWSDRFTTARNLTLVSKDVRQWIDPILHHTVALDTPTKLYVFAATVIARNDPEFFGRTVKVLTIGNLELGHFSETGIELADSMTVVLTACTSIERFAFWMHASGYMPLPPAMHPHPTHLSLAVRIELDSFDFLIEMTSPSLTHLHLDFALFGADFARYTFIGAWSEIFRQCPGLTHLKLSGKALETLRVQDFTRALNPAVSRLPETVTRLMIILWKSIRDDLGIVFVFPENHPLHAVDWLEWYEKHWGFLTRGTS
ncbi:hypothetical protein BDZ89DRAFT_1067643 [Hymenopellis radicata]|nr:hypothetical protein BDZ89DRAFT_1067643 [Hymenopellis radicata]